MFNSMFGYPVNVTNAMSGQNMTMTSGTALQNAYNQNQQTSPQHRANMAAQQQALYNQYSQGMFNQMAADRKHRYMINGRTMTWEEFLDELAPGEDNPMRTFLILKYKE